MISGLICSGSAGRTTMPTSEEIGDSPELVGAAEAEIEAIPATVDCHGERICRVAEGVDDAIRAAIDNCDGVGC